MDDFNVLKTSHAFYTKRNCSLPKGLAVELSTQPLQLSGKHLISWEAPQEWHGPEQWEERGMSKNEGHQHKRDS